MLVQFNIDRVNHISADSRRLGCDPRHLPLDLLAKRLHVDSQRLPKGYLGHISLAQVGRLCPEMGKVGQRQYHLAWQHRLAGSDLQRSDGAVKGGHQVCLGQRCVGRL